MNVRQPDSISLDLPADVAYLGLPGACLAAISEGIDGIGRTGDALYGLQLAVYEACANIVVHSYGISGGKAEDEGSRIRALFTVQVQPPVLTIDLYDTGCPFDISLIPAPDLSEPQTRGYGLYLIRQLVDEVLYEQEPGGNHWKLTKYF